MYIYIYMYIHIYTYIYTYIYIHIRFSNSVPYTPFAVVVKAAGGWCPTWYEADCTCSAGSGGSGGDLESGLSQTWGCLGSRADICKLWQGEYEIVLVYNYDTGQSAGIRLQTFAESTGTVVVDEPVTGMLFFPMLREQSKINHRLTID